MGLTLKTFHNLSTYSKLTIVFAVFLVLMFIVATTLSASVDAFSNSPTSIRRYVVADEGMSLDDKLHRNTRSGLTGSRDVPVFFSDFNVEMTRDANGDLVPVRESFTNEKATDVRNIEDRFLVN